MFLRRPDPRKERDALEAERLRIERRRLSEEARREDARASEEEARARDESARTDREKRRRRSVEQWKTRAKTAGHMAVMSVTNIGVNGVAVSGQAMAFMARGLPPLWAILAAAIVESVAVYVSWHAHVALREGDAAWTTRMLSYLVGAGAGYLSYTHVEDYPELFAACSLASPWLWSMHSRHLHRKDLREKGLIDPRAPKFSPMRWLLHLPETFKAFRWAVGEGVQSPSIAVQVVRQRRRVKKTWKSMVEAQRAVIEAQRSQLQLTLTRMAALAEEIHGPDPRAAEAVHDIAVFVNEVGVGLVPRYRPPLGPAVEADQTPPVPADQPDQKQVGETAPRPRFRTRIRDRYRLPIRTKRRARRRAVGPVAAGDHSDQTLPADAPGPGRHDRTNRTSKRPAGTGSTGPADRVNALLPQGKRIAARLRREGVRLTRRSLQDALRAEGHSASTDVANELVRVLSGPGKPVQRAARGGRTTGPSTGPDVAAEQPLVRTMQTATTGDAE
ncbi:hypothetical protein SAMN05421874_128140 [Nonomuraea maritima]|uniref:DUF2637 domain-containing protein n=1 Tax=Nonomuraea maritima TaxID=683260 RepID=A0A1G9MQF6_9ACTN|nr:hypothetical protein [Nonomuraea maritima]SDL76480.1 hypothetical protein SAMN05421874_128140 [Nonomuraea maritima]